jgi:hypothetical protein
LRRQIFHPSFLNEPYDAVKKVLKERGRGDVSAMLGMAC